MNWEAIGAIAELLGAIAVFITLLYLATQIRQTNTIASSDGNERLIQRFDDANQMVIVDAALRQALYQEGGHTQDQLDQIYSFATFKCNLCLSAQNAHDAGRLDAGLFLSVKKDLVVCAEMWPVTRDAIAKWRANYPDVAHLEVFELL